MQESVWLLLLAGFAGGAVNAAAGGAKLFVFPLLLAAGLPPLMANATGTVALWPAQFTASLAYRSELGHLRPLIVRALPALLGAAIGAVALIFSSEAVFRAVIPFVLAVAVTAIAFGNRTAAFVARIVPADRMTRVSGALLFAAGFYGGYFGAGLGFLIVAILFAAGSMAINRANAEKNLLAFAINSTAVLPLSFSGLVDWRAAVGVIAGGVLGGYAGGTLARRLPERPMRLAIAFLGLVLTAAFLITSG